MFTRLHWHGSTVELLAKKPKEQLANPRARVSFKLLCDLRVTCANRVLIRLSAERRISGWQYLDEDGKKSASDVALPSNLLSGSRDTNVVQTFGNRSCFSELEQSTLIWDSIYPSSSGSDETKAKAGAVLELLRKRARKQRREEPMILMESWSLSGESARCRLDVNLEVCVDPLKTTLIKSGVSVGSANDKCNYGT